MRVGLQLCYAETFQQPGFYSKLYSDFVKFIPEKITYGYKTMLWEDKKHMKLISGYSSTENLVISNDCDDSFLSVISGTNHPHRSLTIIQDSEVFLPDTLEVEQAINFEDFVSAYLYNEDYEFVQSTKHASALSERNLSMEILASIKNTPWKEGVWDKEYDIRSNPGSSELIGYTMLMVAWKMWFGNLFFKLVPKERILSFPYATEIKELPNGQVYVQLYDRIEDPYTPENVFRQWKWKEWLDYDSLIEKYG